MDVMNKYLDANYYCYNSITDCLKHKQGSKFKQKQLLHRHPQLLIVNKTSGDVLTKIKDIQPLYLYPLSILNYCKSLISKEKYFLSSMTTINIINFDTSINYIEKLNKLDLKRLSNIEIEINKNYNHNELNKIIEFLIYISKNNIKITLLFKTLNLPSELLIKLSCICDFFKIMMVNILNTPTFNDFKNKLEIISSNKKDTSAVLIKSYLSLEQNDYYEETINIFDQLNIDIFQLSKDLIPINVTKNPSVSQNIQDNIRNLEKKYNTAETTKFISVKDISTLYYPRFELNERNSRRCYACVMKPYLYKDKLIPCRVAKVINNIDNWYLSTLDNVINNDNLSKCGIDCDDCASIFENDLLNEIESIILKYGRENIEFVLEIEG